MPESAATRSGEALLCSGDAQMLSAMPTRPQPLGTGAHLHRRRGAADPTVVLVDQAAQPESPPRLLQVAVQVADGDDAGHRRQESALWRLQRHGNQDCSVWIIREIHAHFMNTLHLTPFISLQDR